MCLGHEEEGGVLPAVCNICCIFSSAFLEALLEEMGLCIWHGTAELLVLHPSLAQVAIAVAVSQVRKAESVPASIRCWCCPGLLTSARYGGKARSAMESQDGLDWEGP